MGNTVTVHLSYRIKAVKFEMGMGHGDGGIKICIFYFDSFM